MLGWDDLNMDIHSFCMQFSYKPLMILTWPVRKVKSLVGCRENKKLINRLVRKKIIIDFMLGWDALNMDIHSFCMQFRYKPLMILTWPHAKSREEKKSASRYRKKNLPACCKGKEIIRRSSASWLGKK